jgi:4-amino-4-deoxy-L-arabinose transferase-like glycosyltransferase
MKSYGKPPGFFLAAVWATFWPWSVLLIPMGFHTWRRLGGKTAIAIDRRPYQFLVAWVVPMWVFLELARGKLMHYPLPLYVPLAILCADMLVQSWNRLTDVLAAPWFGAARWVMLGIWVMMGGAVLVGAGLAPDRDLIWRCLPFGLALLATGVVSATTWGKTSWPYVVALCWGGSLMMANVMILPEMPELQVSRIAGHEMKALVKADPALHLGVCDYEEATLIFYSGQNMRRYRSVDDMLRNVPFAREGWPALWPTYASASESYVIAVSERVRQELDRRKVRYTELPRTDTPVNLANPPAFTISGFNTGNFKPVSITLISNRPRPEIEYVPGTTATAAEATQPR